MGLDILTLRGVILRVLKEHIELLPDPETPKDPYGALTELIAQAVDYVIEQDGGAYLGTALGGIEWLIKHNMRWKILTDEEVEAFEGELAWVWNQDDLDGDTTDRLLASIGMKR